MLEVQLTVVGITFLCGMALGLLFDVWWACRSLWHSGRLITSVGDLLLWLVAAFLLAVVLQYVNYGELRGWYLFSLALGFACYRETLSPLLKQRIQRVLHFAFMALKVIAIKLGLPVWLPLKFIVDQSVAGGKKGKKLGRAFVRLIRRKLAWLKRKKGP